nr:MAG TPA: hypothetical protein [Bacteriophage sp.]
MALALLSTLLEFKLSKLEFVLLLVLLLNDRGQLYLYLNYGI